jgi:hypothetical protein
MSNRPVIDLLTLDSVQRAACGHMMGSIVALPKEIQDLIEYKAWSTINKEGVGKYIEMKGRVLATIAIQGDFHFESIIRQYQELIDAMADRAPNAELATQIRVLRDKDFDFDNLEANLASAESGQKNRRMA